MIVCVCEGVSDRQVRATVQSGARSVQELSRKCGAGRDCGRCRAMLRGILGESAAPGVPEGPASSGRRL